MNNGMHNQNPKARPGYKWTKLGWVPVEWEVGKVGDLVNKFISGVSVNSEDRTTAKGEFGVLKVSSVSYGRFLPNEHKVIKEEEITRAKVNPESGNILISRANTFHLVGTSVLVEKDYPRLFLSDKIWQTEFDKNRETNSAWLNFLLQSRKVRGLIGGLATGTSGSMKNITQTDFLNLPIPIPPFEEQQKIATILSTWDRAIALTRQLITAKEEQKKGLMQRLLTGKVRVAGFEGEWEEVTLKQIAERVMQKNTELNDNVVTISAERGFVKQEDFFNKRVASKTLSHYYLVEKGDYCYNKSYSGNYPMGAFKRLDAFDKAVVTTLYICFRLKASKVDSDFILSYFEAGLMIRGLMKIAQEGGRAHGLLNIGLDDFFGLKLTLPSLKEQVVIGQVLNHANTEIQLFKTQLAALQEQKQGLMQQLLTGKIRVNP